MILLKELTEMHVKLNEAIKDKNTSPEDLMKIWDFAKTITYVVDKEIQERILKMVRENE